jgi:hypothetical protein
MDGRKADIEYLRILHLAATTMECEVEAALGLLLEEGTVPEADRVKELVAYEKPEVPDMPVLVVDLADYDGLLQAAEEVAL